MMEAIDKAIYYLNIKPRTRKQVIDYLEKKEYPSDEIKQVIESLEEYHYIDDENYCRLYFEMGFEKGRGIARIKRELAEKGVEKALIDQVLEEMDSVPDQYEMALELGQSLLYEFRYDAEEEYTYEDKQKLRAKLSRRLASRGYPADIVYKVARNLID